MAPLDASAVRERHHDAVPLPHHRLRAGLRQECHPAAQEDALDHGSGILVFAGEHLVATGDERDLGTQVHVRRCELRTGNARADHDEVLRQRLHVVELRPGQDAFPVGLGTGKLTRRGAHGDHKRVGLDAVEVRAAGTRGDDHGVVILDAAVSLEDRDACLQQGSSHVLGLLARQGEEPLVDLCEVDCDLRLERATVATLGEQLNTELPRVGDRDSGVSRRDERLGRYDVGDDRRAADTGPLDEGDVRPQLRCRERRLVAAGTTADDRDGLGALEAQRHASIVSASPRCSRQSRVPRVGACQTR